MIMREKMSVSPLEIAAESFNLVRFPLQIRFLSFASYCFFPFSRSFSSL